MAKKRGGKDKEKDKEKERERRERVLVEAFCLTGRGGEVVRCAPMVVSEYSTCIVCVRLGGDDFSLKLETEKLVFYFFILFSPFFSLLFFLSLFLISPPPTSPDLPPRRTLPCPRNCPWKRRYKASKSFFCYTNPFGS